MATLTGQSIASSYEQLLHVDNDGGGNGTTLVDVKDGDNGTTFAIKLATDRAEIIGVGGTVSGTPDGDGDEFVIRNNADAGMSILAGESSGHTSSIIFGSASDLNGANVFYEYNTKTMKLGTQHSSGILTLRSGNGSDALTINASQNIGIGIASPDVNFHIKLADTANARIEDTSADGIAKLDFKNDARTSTIGLYGDDSDNFKIDHGGGSVMIIDVGQVTSFSGNILPVTDDAQDLGSGSKRFDDIHATNGTIQTSDQTLKDNIADSSLGLDFVNALRPVEYKWKDYSYEFIKEEASEAKAKQKTVSKEVEKTRTEIVEEDGKYVQKEISYTETLEEPQYQEVDLYNEDGKVIGLHQIPIMEEVKAKDALIETKEKTFVRTHFGLIAQEVEQVLKDKKLTNNDFAGLIYDEDSKRYGMRYSELIAPLIKAVQELSEKVTELENK